MLSVYKSDGPEMSLLSIPLRSFLKKIISLAASERATISASHDDNDTHDCLADPQEMVAFCHSTVQPDVDLISQFASEYPLR